MAGMDVSLALMSNVECEASSNMAHVKVTPIMSVRPLAAASPSTINLEGECAAGMEDVLQEAAIQFGTVNAEEEDAVSTIVPLHLKPAAVSSTVDVANFVLPHLSNPCPHSDGLEEEDAVSTIVHLKIAAGSSTVDVADFVSAHLSNPCPHSDDFGIICNAEECMKSGQLLNTGEGMCKLLSDSTDFENGKNLNEVRATKQGQICAICHDNIKVEETAEIKGCEHSYCVTCILRWASYKAEPWCPQCRLPFSFLYVYKALDGTLRDYLCEESVCLLLRAFWFKPLVFHEPEEQDDYQDDYDAYEERYYTSSVRLGNRRWGDSGYVRAGRCEARPVGVRQVGESGSSTSSSSRQAKGKEPAKEVGKEPAKEVVGRRARRAQKREQLDKMSGKK